MSDAPTHLLLPLLASILLVCGLIVIKRSSTAGVSPWTVTFLANQWAAVAFSCFWFLGGTMQPTQMLWQPAVIAGLYVLGQVFTFCAIEHGDVSVATPVLGIKVVLVALLVVLIAAEQLPTSIWYAAAMSTCGIALVQSTGSQNGERKKVAQTIALAVGAAGSFALFDVLVQKWAPAWGAGRFLPITYWMVAVLSLIFLPALQFDLLRTRGVRGPLLAGTLLIALQAICIVFTLSTFGDAARVNVVYSLRGMWGVLLAWAVAVKWGGNEAQLPRRTMIARLIGAALLTAAVVLVIASSQTAS